MTISVTAVNKSSKRGKIRKHQRKWHYQKIKTKKKNTNRIVQEALLKRKKRREKSTTKWFWKCFQIRERNKREYG